MYLYTVATHNYGYYEALIISAKNNNYQLINLAKNKKWKGLVWKFNLMLKALKNHNENDIICFCDGFDVIVNRKSEEFREYFLKNNCDIMFGYENSNLNDIFHFLSKFSFEYYHLLDRNNVPNTGVYIGYVGKIKKFIKLCLKLDNTDDQDMAYYIYHNMKKFNLNIKLDNKIYTIPFENNLSYLLKPNGNKNITKITGNLKKIFYIHANGNRNMDIYCKKLSLPLKNLKSKSNHNHLIHYAIKTLKNNFFFIIFIIIILKIIKNY